ncbi:hypothetical protein MRS44_009565 [Fusarium solani]|uniref:Phosphotransferase family protein n=1 Tax=Fusarium solani TaxID=169388 RepID=A0A9P9JX52_FUSSL|nr:phosphotransferase family protein [Fusarium solani]KAH7232064.1 phosphotransferase family protein [Fusarium solani]KAJ3464779.1 hypothetical protein MRS44_009565 [Fusarium solani]
MTQLPSRVLETFSILAEPVPIDGGRGLCFQAGNVVLKPSDDDQEAEWVAELCESIMAKAPSGYRISRPIRSPHGFVFEGWTAWALVPGRPAPESNFAAILKACRAFHADIATVCTEKPPFLLERRNRWTEADLVTWGEKSISDVADVNTDILSLVNPVLQQLSQLRKELPSDIGSQLIHGDLIGNVLFDENNPTAPPGIIDITPYWRPALFAEAIAVADGLAWHGQSEDLVEMYGTDEVHLQLLVRALYWRCLTFAIDSDEAWVRENWPRTDYRRAADIVQKIMGK